MNRKIDLKGLIPSGNELRILLNSKHISEGEINFTLKGKGIFCGSGDKIFSVPLLSATLLTSNEYENILTIIPITSLKNGRKVYPNELFLEHELEKPSILLCQQIRTISKERLVKKLTTISSFKTQEKILQILCNRFERI